MQGNCSEPRTKKHPCKGVFFENNSLAGHVAQNWNTILPSLLTMYGKLVELGINEVMDG